MPKSRYLGAFEQMLMLAALRLRGEAYGTRIAEEIRERSGRAVNRGSLYVTFDRLEARGLIESEYTSGDEPRRGRRRRIVRVTPTGLDALREARAALTGLWDGLEAELDGRA